MTATPTVEEIRIFLDSKINENCLFAFLMGSAATERFNDQSDIDLGICWKVEPEFSQILRIQSELGSHFQRDVDLVSLNKIDPIYGHQILATGRILINNSPGELLKWKMQQMSLYPDFKYSRKIIEENILKRKKYV